MIHGDVAGRTRRRSILGFRRRLSDAIGEFTPRRVTAVYLAFGLGALFVSDLLMLALFSDPFLQQLQTVKGGIEVLLTGGLIYVLTVSSRSSLQDTNAELERHREELRVLHRLLRHNLRNDLTIIRGEAERLHEAVDAENVSSCESVLSAAESMIDYTERAQTIRKLTEHDRRTVDLAELVPAIVEDHRNELDGVDLRTTLPRSAPVESHEFFDRALSELLTNAVVHGTDRPTIEVTVEPDCDRPGMTLVEVRDDGPGLPEYAEDVLRGSKRDQLVHLEGLGLWLAYLTVVESGGAFTIPADDAGTTIRMYLPTADQQAG